MPFQRPIVYLIAQPTVKKDGSTPNMEPLSEHGDVKVVIPAGEYPTFHPQRALDLIGDRLEDFDYQRDFVAWAGGDTLSALLVGAVLSGLDTFPDSGVAIPYFQYLRYERGRDAKTGERTDKGARYVPVKIPLSFSGNNPLLTVPTPTKELCDDDD